MLSVATSAQDDGDCVEIEALADSGVRIEADAFRPWAMIAGDS